MVTVKGGTFTMGDVKDIYSPILKPKINHTLVSLDTFHLCDHTVTREEWAAVYGNECSAAEAKLPQTEVSWHKAYEFIAKLNKLLDWHFRLPTEAEWEFAARGAEFQKENEIFSGGSTLDLLGWYCENSHSMIHPIKEKSSNPLGLYDMSGNIWEWCSDIYQKYYPHLSRERDSLLGRIFLGEIPMPSHNPTGGLSGDYRVLRGGAYNEKDYKCWVFYRNWEYPTYFSKNIGFRLAY